GGKPEQLDPLPVPNRNIFTVAARVDKRAILHQLRLDEFIEQFEPNPNAQKEELAEEEARTFESLRKLTMAALNYHDTRKQFPSAAKTDARGRKLLSWRIELLPFVDENELYEQ